MSVADLPGTDTVDLWRDVVGQDAAVAELRAAVATPVHAYLLVGPRGSGKRALARAFAAASAVRDRVGEDARRHVELALAEAHPDLTVFERKGAKISVEQADQIIGRASRASVEGGPKVLVLDEFHLVTDAGPKLLKSIEEPSVGTVFLVLADQLTPDLDHHRQPVRAGRPRPGARCRGGRAPRGRGRRSATSAAGGRGGCR